MTKWLQLLSASFIRGLWLRIHMHHPTETTPRAAGLSAVGAWGGAGRLDGRYALSPTGHR